MKNISRLLLFGALTLMLLIAACAPEEGTPTVVGALPGDTVTPFPEATLDVTATDDQSLIAPAVTETTETATTQTGGIPVTGIDQVVVECQYCIGDMAHALLILPDTATFEVLTQTASVTTQQTNTGCFAVDTFDGRQTVICRSPENTSMNVNICTDPANCTQLTIDLQSCPDTGALVPGATAASGDAGDTTDTATPGVIPTSTPPLDLGSPTATP